MLNAVLNELNNYFFKYSTTTGTKQYSFSKDITFTANDTLEADFADTFIVSEYVLIEGSRVNDGVYLISAIDDTSITIDTTVDLVIKTEPEASCTITKLFIPQELLQVIAEIKTYNAKANDGVASESIDDYSISYQGGSSDENSWPKVFRGKLGKWKRLGWC